MKRAETIADVGVLPLSRRDRVTMEYALQAVRSAMWPPHCSERALFALSHALVCAGICYAAEVETLPSRLLRARLALALRVLLRVDRGDRGKRWWHCSLECGAGGLCWRALPGRHSLGECGGVRVFDDYEPVRPLWQDAPPHDGPTPAERRRLREVG